MANRQFSNAPRRGGARLCVAALIGAATLGFAAGARAQDERCGDAVNFEQADIRAVIDEFTLRTGRKFIVDPRVAGTITIKSSPTSTLCPEEAWELFQAALRVTGYTATPVNGDSYKIIPIQDGARAAGPVGEGVAGDFVTQIVRLNFVDAREAAAPLAQIVSERGVISPVRTGNALIIVDEAANVQRIREVLAQIDRDPTVYRTVDLVNISAAEAAQVVRRLASEISEESSGQRSPVTVLPVEASNSILLRAEPSTLQRLSNVISDLDRMGQTKSDLSVITLNHANAEDMIDLLREIANASPQIAATQGGGGQGGEAVVIQASGNQEVNISVYPPTNSIIISGNAAIQGTLRSVIAQLDIRRPQVLVEAIIVEVNDSTLRDLGVQYFVTGDGTNSSVPFVGQEFQRQNDPNVLAAAGAALLNGADEDSGFDFDPGPLAQAALTSLLGVNGLAFGGIGEFGDGNFFGAILTALQQDDETRILSLPSVLTLDNQPATLTVAQEIPITTGEAVGDNFSGGAFRTVSREEVGIILEVTPRISEGDTVILEVRQEASSVAGQALGGTDFITNNRSVETVANIDDGDILVLGGLINQQEDYFDSKIPLLGDIPIAGNLFKTSSRTKRRDNLMVFIRPTIVRDRRDAAGATSKKYDYIRAREMLSTGRAQSELDRLIEQVTGSAYDDVGGPPDAYAGPETIAPPAIDPEAPQ